MEKLVFCKDEETLPSSSFNMNYEGQLFCSSSSLVSLNGYWAVVLRNVLRTSFVTKKKTKRVHAVLASCDKLGNVDLDAGLLELDGSVSKVIYTKGVFALKTKENNKTVDAVQPVWDLSKADFATGCVLHIEDSKIEGFIPDYGFKPSTASWTKVDSNAPNSPYAIPEDEIRVHTVHTVTTVLDSAGKPIEGAWMSKYSSDNDRKEFIDFLHTSYLALLDRKAVRYEALRNQQQQQ